MYGSVEKFNGSGTESNFASQYREPNEKSSTKDNLRRMINSPILDDFFAFSHPANATHYRLNPNRGFKDVPTATLLNAGDVLFNFLFLTGATTIGKSAIELLTGDSQLALTLGLEGATMISMKITWNKIGPDLAYSLSQKG